MGYGGLVIIYPKPYSIYLRGTIPSRNAVLGFRSWIWGSGFVSGILSLCIALIIPPIDWRSAVLPGCIGGSVLVRVCAGLSGGFSLVQRIFRSLDSRVS